MPGVRWPYDWYGHKRTFLLYQVRCLAFDILCAPLVTFLVVLPWRFYTFWSSLSNAKVVDDCLENFFPADLITDHPSCWRFKAIKNFFFLIKDIVSIPFFLFSVVSWRNPIFFRCYRHEVRYILQQINAKPSENTAPRADPVTDFETSMVGVAPIGENSHEPNSISSNSKIIPTTARFLMSSPPQDDSIPPAQTEESAASPVPAVADPSPVSAPIAPTEISSAALPHSPATPVDTLPWFDPITMDWHVCWRELSFIQTLCLFLDFLTLPFLVLYMASVYRVCIFPLPISQFISSTDASSAMLEEGTASLEDWDIPLRALLINHTLCIVWDVLCFPFFVIAKLSWRGHTLAKPSAINRPAAQAEIPIAAVIGRVDYAEFVPNSNQLPVVQEANAAPAHDNSELQLNHRRHSVDDHPSLLTCFRDLFLHQVRLHVRDLRFNFAHHSADGGPSSEF
jgi:hypothetical protein